MYTFSFIVGNTIPKRVKCIHSATKFRVEGLGFRVLGLGFFKARGLRRVRGLGLRSQA